MREIQFRGKRIDNGEWVEGDLIIATDRINSGKAYILPSVSDFSYGDNGNRIRIGCFVEVDPSTICQFTGLCDKNGVRIFEGDILHFWSDYREAYTGECVVKYGDFNCNCCEGVYGWYLENGDIRYLSNEENPVYEVCGNLHDNPEFLEGEG